MEEILAGVGMVILAVGIISIIISISAVTFTIILLCFAVKEKGELKLKGIDADRIKKIGVLAILSLISSLLSCVGSTVAVAPILALVFINSNAKNALKAGDVAEAEKKSDLALLLIIISNSAVLGLTALNTFIGIINSIIS